MHRKSIMDKCWLGWFFAWRRKSIRCSQRNTSNAFFWLKLKCIAPCFLTSSTNSLSLYWLGWSMHSVFCSWLLLLNGLLIDIPRWRLFRYSFRRSFQFCSCYCFFFHDIFDALNPFLYLYAPRFVYGNAVIKLSSHLSSKAPTHISSRLALWARLSITLMPTWWSLHRVLKGVLACIQDAGSWGEKVAQ